MSGTGTFRVEGDFNFFREAFCFLDNPEHKTGTFNGIIMTTDNTLDDYHILYNPDMETILLAGHSGAGLSFKINSINNNFKALSRVFNDNNQKHLSKVVDIVKAFEGSVLIYNNNNNILVQEYKKGVLIENNAT